MPKKGETGVRQFGLSNGNSALTDRQVRAIRKNVHGWTAKTQAEVYKVGLMTIYRVRWNETYPDVN